MKVYLAWDEDNSHGIQVIIGVYSNMEAAMEAARRFAHWEPCVQAYAVEDNA